MKPDERYKHAEDRYKAWLNRVNVYLNEHYGVVLDDLPDVPTRDWYDNDWTYKTAAHKAIQMADA